MADIDITQEEADALIAMEKQRVDDKQWSFAVPGERLAIPLISSDKREHFVLDASRSQLKLTKATYQNRARQAIVLMRLDLDGSPHRNPDGTEIPCPHLHFYREGYGANGPIPHLLRGTPIRQTCIPPSKRSWPTATSLYCRISKRGSSHDDVGGNR